MKIAMVTPYDLAASSGVNSYARTLSAWLRHEGHSVDLIGPLGANASQNAIPQHAVPIGRARRIRAGRTRVPVTLSPRTGRHIRRRYRREQYDLVHIHEPFMPLLSLQALRRAEAPVVGTFHGSERVGRAGYRLAAPLLRRWARRLDACTAVSTTAQHAARPYAHDAEIIPCPVDSAHFAAPLPPPPLMAQPAATAPGAQPRRYLLFVGRGDKRKGLPVLLRAFDSIHAERPDVHLVVAGPLEGATRSLADRVRRGPLARAVHFAGQIGPGALPAYYQHATVFCSPATGGESFGIVLAEAMAAGTPVVATAIDGYTDVVEDGRDGLLVPPKDHAALAAAIARVLDEGALADRLRRAGRERVHHFDVAAVGQRHLDLYDRTMQGRRG